MQTRKTIIAAALVWMAGLLGIILFQDVFADPVGRSFRYTDGDRHTGCYLFYGGRYAHAETTERRTAGFTAASLSR